MQKLTALIASLSCAILFTGCITSRSPDCFGYTHHLPDGKEKKSLAYSFIRSSSISPDKEFDAASSTPAYTGGWVGAQSEAAALAQFRGVFEPITKTITPTVDRNGGDCEIMLKIHQQNSYNPLTAFPAFICGFTFCCIPCWGDDVYYLNVIATNKKGLKKEYLIKRKISTTTWLPFILAMPFSELPGTAMSKITVENWKELRCKMEDDGFFEVSNVSFPSTK